MSGLRRVTSVDAVNRMTARWIQGCRADESSVFCAPSAWPLLALLADAADGRGRAELEHAVGLPAAESRAAALEILGLLREMTAVRSAVGIWAADQIVLDPAWTSGLPVGAIGRLSGNRDADRPRLDGWVQQHTDGLIDRMPVEVDDETMLLLAAAMSVRTRWVRPFAEWGHLVRCETSPWHGLCYDRLSRVSRIVDRVSVGSTDHGEITCLEILGLEGITVHLVIGEEGRAPAEVLQGGLVARDGRGRRRGGRLQIGDTAPGLVVERVRDDESDDRLLVLTPRFQVEGDHDLCKRPEVFGLDAVTDMSRGHFPAISRTSLALSKARQRAAARFTAKGFEAAAVTAMPLGSTGIPPLPPRLAKQVRVEFDRPFGFFASHRTSGLVLAAGWVAEPEPYGPADWIPEDRASPTGRSSSTM